MNTSQSRPWLDKASEDLTVARLVLKEGHTAHACFLAQQCIEKSLKAYHIARANSYPRTHNLVDLQGLCEKIDPSFAEFLDECIRIDEYYIPTRYPEGIPGIAPLGTPSAIAAENAVTSAEHILQFVAQKLI